jgi:hypothetical protein
MSSLLKQSHVNQTEGRTACESFHQQLLITDNGDLIDVSQERMFPR